MLLSIGLIVVGLVLLIVGGETLLRGSVGLASLLRLTPAVIGLTVVAAGTSMPELAVSAMAAVQQKADLAVSNVVGSNIFNICAILGLCAVLRPFSIGGNTIRLEYPVLVLVTLLALVVVQDGEINRLDAVLLLAIYVGFTVYMISLVRQQLTETETQGLREEIRERTPARLQPQPWGCLGLIVVGIALLVGGARATVVGAVELARLAGFSERVIGLTIVSAGTGLPEVVASIVASLRGRSDMAIGNVIGSNLFNILAILGLSALLWPMPVQGALLTLDGWWMLGVTLMLFPLMFSGLRVRRWEGALLLAVYGAYLGILLTVPA